MSDDRARAVIELHRYLSGLIPPLRAAEVFDAMVRLTPERILSEIHAWVREQRAANATIPVSEYLFHAIRRLYLVGELGLVDTERVEAFFDWLLPLAVEASPHEERPRLRGRIAAMTHRVAVVPTSSGNVPIPVLPTAPPLAASASPEPPPVAPEPEPQSPLDRFELVVARIAREQATGRRMDSSEALGTLAQVVMLAAEAASTRDELRDLMRRIPSIVDPKQIGTAFQLLGRAIPPWEVVLGDEDRAACVPSAIRAMRKVVSLSADDLERSKRLRELMLAAVEQFNAGSLYAAAEMLDLARAMADEAGLAKTTALRIQGEVASALDEARLRACVAERSRHALLRKVLGYLPSLTPMAVLADLRGEHRPERRRSLLALLEAWGPAARTAAMDKLRDELELGGAADTWFLRNTIFLLHRIPRPADANVAEELELLREASSQDQVIYVVKEAITAIASVPAPQATRLLVDRLTELEVVLITGDESQGPRAESFKAVERLIAGLARIGTPEAIRRIVAHGLKTEPALGDTRARLACLEQVDISASPDALEMLLAAVRAELPGRFARVIGKAANPIQLIQTLSGTDTVSVRALLDEIANRFPKTALGSSAESTLARLTSEKPVNGTTARPAAGKETGELRPFGVPELVQSLSESMSSGVLAIAGPDKEIRGRLVLARGNVADAETTRLRDDEAFFDLVEHPEGGWYSFKPRDSADGNLDAGIAPLLVEALRRHDQLMRDRVLVPDRSTWAHKGVRPTPHPEEKEPPLMKEVWRRAMSGQPVSSWERTLSADAFRVRRLLVHWLEEGAIGETGP